MQGWICLHRQLLEWEWYSDINTTRLFVHCLLRANHKAKKWQGTDVPAGSFIGGLNALSEQTGLSVQQLRTCIQRLKSTSDITVKSTNKFSLITVTNWASYQDKEEQQQADQQANQQSNNNQITNEQQSINNKQQCKQLNNDNNVTKKIDKTLVELKHDESEFDLQWTAYGKKGNRKTSLQKFKKLNDKQILSLKNHLPQYVQSTPETKYRKNFESYLNQECWNDEVAATTHDKHSGFKDRDYNKDATKSEDLSWMQ
jgi:hypothetical protein